MLYADTDGLHGSPEGSSGTRSSTYIQADPDGTAISVKAIADCTVEGGYVLSSGGAYVPTEVEKQRFAAGETIIPRVSGSTGVEFLAYLIVR